MSLSLSVTYATIASSQQPRSDCGTIGAGVPAPPKAPIHGVHRDR